MTIEDNIRVESNNMILTERQHKNCNYHQLKLIYMNNLQLKKYHPLIEQAMFTYYPLGKA